MGYRPEGSNSCRGLKRYRRRGRERFLSDEEILRFGALLSKHEAANPLEVAAVRLLLLTGCRKGELRTLRWSDYREVHLFLCDSKTEPRTVWLSGPARGILERLRRTSGWVFPTSGANGLPDRNWPQGFWQRIRDEANLSDVRLHDLRHSFTSRALAPGESLSMSGQLMRHTKDWQDHTYVNLARDSIKASILGASGREHGADMLDCRPREASASADRTDNPSPST